MLKTAAGEGYDMVGHGWVNDHDATEQEMELELHDIRRCSAAIAEACGSPPARLGQSRQCRIAEHARPSCRRRDWGGTATTRATTFLSFAGTKNGNIVVLPKTNIPHNDLLMWLISNNSPEVMWDNFKTTFDELYAEGEAGNPMDSS